MKKSGCSATGGHCDTDDVHDDHNEEDYGDKDDDDDHHHNGDDDDRLARVCHGLEQEELLHLTQFCRLFPSSLSLSHVHLHA